MPRSIASLSCLLIGLLALPAAAQQFSADMVHIGGNGRNERQKVYVQDGKMRMEMGGRQAGILIADQKAKTAFVVLPDQKAYMDAPQASAVTHLFEPLDPNDPCPQWKQMAQNARPEKGGEWSCKRVGSETVNGRSTVKYETVSPDGDHHFGWLDPKLRFLVKTESAKSGGMELQDIKEGPQAASLFEMPADYQKLDTQQLIQRMRERAGKPPGG